MKRVTCGVVPWYFDDGGRMIARGHETGYTEHEIPGVGYATTSTLTHQRGDTVGLAVGNQLTIAMDYDAKDFTIHCPRIRILTTGTWRAMDVFGTIALGLDALVKGLQEVLFYRSRVSAHLHEAMDGEDHGADRKENGGMQNDTI